MRSLKDILEGLLRGEEATLIDGDDIVRSPEIILNVKCKDIQQIADVVGKCVGQKIKVKKMKGKWMVNAWGQRIDVDGCPGFAIEHIGKARFGDAPIRKLWFAVWEGRLICRQDRFYYSRKTTEYTSNIKDYKKHRSTLGVIGSGTQRIDNMYHWGDDNLWEWLSKHGFNEFFDKNS